MKDHAYFSDMEQGPKARVLQDMTLAACGGIIAAIRSRIADGSFGFKYPSICPDGSVCCGCDGEQFSLALGAEVPEFPWPMDPRALPPTLAVLDAVEFCYRAVGKPKSIGHHGYFDHDHLQFEEEEGKNLFLEDINRILARNGLAYELTKEGRIVRSAQGELGELLRRGEYSTGDAELDALLRAARAKYLDPDPNVRRESLEKLWDAWERLKTLEQGKDKKESASKLLEKVSSEATFRETLNLEAVELTRIGNTFRIRHSEVNQVALERDEHVDYLFHRLVAMIYLLLRGSGRLH
jgi:hypothetical protein